MTAFKIPAIFTAIDRVTAPVRQMTASVNRFIGVSESGIARQERVFKRLTPVLSETTSQMLSFAKSAAIAGGVIASITFSINKIKEFDSALASFRTIVSDLSDTQFAEYRKGILAVANTTKKSTVDVASSFEKIAGLNADFAETAQGLASVSAAAITLAKASGDDLGASAENLVGIMNQFKLSADQADRAINVLAAGQAVGAANIRQTADAFVNFGSVAAGANITLEQSVGLIQTLGKYSLMGSEAGTKLRGAVLKLQQAGVGYKSGQFQINDALEEARKKFDSIRNAKARDAAMTKMFGAENITAGRILLSNIDVYKQFTDAVTNTTEAQKAAAINSNTLANRIDELKNKWVNILTANNDVSGSLVIVKDLLQSLTDNLEDTIAVGITFGGMFLAWKVWILLSKAALIGYSVVLGITNALMGKSAFTVMGNTVAYGAYRAAVVASTIVTTAYNAIVGVLTGKMKLAYAAQLVWNAVMMANPIGLIIVAIGALISIIGSLIRNWDMVKKAFTDKGIIGGILAIGKVLLDAVLWPLQKILEVASYLPGIGDWAAKGAESIERFRRNMGMNVGEAAPVLQPNTAENEALAKKLFEMNSRQTVDLNIKTEKGTTAEVGKTSGNAPRVTTTTAQFGY